MRSKFRHNIGLSGYEQSQFPPFTCLARSIQLNEENDYTHNIQNHYF